MTRPRARLLLCLVGLLASGCAADPTEGWSSESTFRTDIRTVAVPIFENETFNRNVEYELTDALVKEIESRTPYRVTSSAQADTILLGRIRKVELDQLSRSRRTGLSEEVVLAVTIDFQWKDLRNDTVLVERRSFAGSALFDPSAPTSEPIELGEFAIAQSLARDIVSEMRASW